MRVLFLTPRFPYPPLKGDQLIFFHRLRHLSRRHEITLISLVEREQELDRLHEELASRQQIQRRLTEELERAAQLRERERAENERVREQLAARERELDALERSLRERLSLATAQPAPAAAVVRAGAPAGAYTLDQLERLVEEHAPRQPDKGEEWRAYVVFLRDFARADGSLPPTFDGLVEEVFGELLG